MRRIVAFFVVCLLLLGSISLGSLAIGYYAHREQIQPVFSLAERIITKGRRVLGMPTETHDMVRRVETTYLTMRGTVHLMPENDFKTGGALTKWDEDLIVIHTEGRIFYLDEERGLVETELGVPDNQVDAYVALAAAEYPDQSTRERSLRYNDIEFIDSPVFRGLVLSYTFIDVDNHCYRNRVSRVSIGPDISSIRELTLSPSDWEILYDSQPCLEFNDEGELIVGYMAGGRVAYKAPDLLYFGNGEYHREGFYRPDAGIQSADSDYGKTIEINLATGTARHYSIGHRNLQGVVVDAEGRLWTTEHGMRGGDELNLIIEGENYGWPLENLGTLYSGIPAPTEGRIGRHEIYRAPVYAWLPSAAPSSLELVDGFHEAWDGDLLIGSLRARTLFRARIRDDRLMFLESIPIGQRIRDVLQWGPERLALWLDTNELVVLQIEPRQDPLEGLVAALKADGMETALAERAHDVLTGCNECHSYEEDVHGAGPSLRSVFGRDIASSAFANYSQALLSTPGIWNRETLSAYLAAPQDVVPGTQMAGLGTGGDADLANALSSALAWLSSQ